MRLWRGQAGGILSSAPHVASSGKAEGQFQKSVGVTCPPRLKIEPGRRYQELVSNVSPCGQGFSKHGQANVQAFLMDYHGIGMRFEESVSIACTFGVCLVSLKYLGFISKCKSHFCCHLVLFGILVLTIDF